jgi:hypothetical protein
MSSSIERSRHPLFAVQSFGGGAGSCTRFCFCLPSIFPLLALCTDLLDAIAVEREIGKMPLLLQASEMPFRDEE